MVTVQQLLKFLATFVDRTASLVSGLIHCLAILSLLAIVGVLAYGALMRYVFSAPVPYTEEVSSLLFVALSFLSLARIFMTGRHITFGGKSGDTPDTGSRTRRLLGLAFAAVTLTFLLPPTLDYAVFSRELGARSDVAELLLWPWMSLIPLGLSVLLLAIVGRILGIAAEMLERRAERRQG